tara:strand:- start:31 stop:609 length:579 start_codon:yes stop_codon:yes gene_type:complete
MNKLTTAQLVVAVQAHAVENYDKGWDIWVESLDTTEKEDIVQGARTENGAIKKAAKWLAPQLEIHAIGHENASTYDNDDGAYERAQENAEQSEDELVAKKGSVIPAKKKAAYGKKAHNGDEVALMLKDYFSNGSKEEAPRLFQALANENGIDGGRWEHLNFGMQRMNLGNVIRGLVAKDEQEVTINGTVIAG